MKGFWRTVESAIAVIIMLTFLLTVGGVYIVSDDTDISPIGYEKLRDLDGMGELRPYAVSWDYESINSRISIPGHNHSISICDQGGVCNGTYPDSGSVAVSTYIISGDYSYEPRELRLYIWKGAG